MTDVEKIALWAGLISSIVSIVLSVVATTFAILVNNRSEKVSDATIKSLQKIESTVERLSDDTSSLIKAAWDTMLGSFSGNSLPKDAGVSSKAAREIASGLATEVRSDIGLPDQESGKTGEMNVTELSKKVDRALEKMQESITGQLKGLARQNRPAAVFNKVNELERLSPSAQSLAASIKAHLTREQYDALDKGPLGEALRELRKAGVLIPVTGFEDGKDVPVYYFPPNQARNLRSALLLLGRPPADVKQIVNSELARVKYDPDRFD